MQRSSERGDEDGKNQEMWRSTASNTTEILSRVQAEKKLLDGNLEGHSLVDLIEFL